MTVADFFCENHACRNRGVLLSLPWRDGKFFPLCENCGKVMRENVSAPSVIWTGAIGQRYRDKTKEGFHDPDGIKAYTRKTKDGKPQLVHLSDWSAVKEHCRSEGLADPRSLPANMEVGDDGKTVKNTCGMPGTEV